LEYDSSRGVQPCQISATLCAALRVGVKDESLRIAITLTLAKRQGRVHSLTLIRSDIRREPTIATYLNGLAIQKWVDNGRDRT
jgi:hypothetical protein